MFIPSHSAHLRGEYSINHKVTRTGWGEAAPGVAGADDTWARPPWAQRSGAPTWWTPAAGSHSSTGCCESQCPGTVGKRMAIYQLFFTFMVLGKSSSPPSVVKELSSSLSHSKDSKPTKASSLNRGIYNEARDGVMRHSEHWALLLPSLTKCLFFLPSCHKWSEQKNWQIPCPWHQDILSSIWVLLSLQRMLNSQVIVRSEEPQQKIIVDLASNVEFIVAVQ